jgi:hypothetical protein
MNYLEKIKINNKIKLLKHNIQYLKVYEIIKKDNNININKSKNGIYFDINKLKIETLEELDIYLNKLKFNFEI